MIGRRARRPLRQFVEAGVLMVGGAVLAWLNTAVIVAAVNSGTVGSLHKDSHDLVRFAAEPGWFVFNLSVRGLLDLLLLYVVFAGWTLLREPPQ